MKKLHIKIGSKILAGVLILQIVVMLLVSVFVTNKVTNDARESAVNNMLTMVQEATPLALKCNSCARRASAKLCSTSLPTKLSRSSSPR